MGGNMKNKPVLCKYVDGILRNLALQGTPKSLDSDMKNLVRFGYGSHTLGGAFGMLAKKAKII